MRHMVWCPPQPPKDSRVLRLRILLRSKSSSIKLKRARITTGRVNLYKWPQGLTISQHLVNRVFSKVISPKFRRDANSYTSFWNLFENALHKNGGLAVMGKFIFFTRYWKARQQERYRFLTWRQQVMVQPSKSSRIALEDHSISSQHIW